MGVMTEPAIHTCTDWNEEAPPEGCHVKVTEPVAWKDGWGNPFCPPCAHRRFSTSMFMNQPTRVATQGFSASGSGGGA